MAKWRHYTREGRPEGRVEWVEDVDTGAMIVDTRRKMGDNVLLSQVAMLPDLIEMFQIADTMRDAQRAWFKHREHDALIASKRLEKELDEKIDALRKRLAGVPEQEGLGI